MVSPKTVSVATFGYGRIVNIRATEGQIGKVAMEGQEQAEVCSAGRKRSWEEYDADDESVEDEEIDLSSDVEECGGVRV